MNTITTVTDHDELKEAFKRYVLLARKYSPTEGEEREFERLQEVFSRHRDFISQHECYQDENGLHVECLHDIEEEPEDVEEAPVNNQLEDIGAKDPVAHEEGQGVTVSQNGSSPFKPILEIPKPNNSQPNVKNSQPKPVSNKPELEGGITLAALLATEFKEPEWVVPDILPVGLAAIGGRPKIGKSYMLVKLAAESSQPNGEFLGKPVGGQKVLYLALEDSPRRFTKRMREWGAMPNNNLEIHFKWPTGQKGIDRLKTAIASGFTFIIVDTISVFLGGKNQLKAEEMNVVFQKLHELTLEANNPVCILLVDHFPKRVDPETNPVDALFGSTAKAAKLDVALGIYNQRGKSSKLFKVQGRDLEDLEFNFAFEPKKGRLEIVGDNGKPEISTVQEQVLDAIAEMNGATNQQIAEALDKDQGNIYRQLQELIKKGKIKKDDNQRPYTYLII